jgi:phage terminase large subunit-like protein
MSSRVLALRVAEVLQELKTRKEMEKYEWLTHARPAQLIPEGDWWTYWLILAGRGFGKTRTGAETVRQWVTRHKEQYVNLIGATADDARDIMIEGESGILICCPKDERPVYKKSERKLVWPNGAQSLIFTADEPERLRGKQHSKLWADELAAWRYPEAWDQAMFGLRLGLLPQAVITTTPKPTKIIKELAKDENTFITTGSTYDNQSNLAPSFFKSIIKKYEGTRLGRQELNAEILDDNPNALWKRKQIDADRVTDHPPLKRIVVGVDPAVTAVEGSDLTGIVCAGLGENDEWYILADNSILDTPAKWAKQAVVTYVDLKADRIVGEANNGGDLVELAIRTVEDGKYVGKNVSYKKVHASRAKITRAEPVAALYEQHRVHHVGFYPELEDEMCDYDPLVTKKSPDRMDALVWAMTELMDEGTTGLLEYYKRKLEKKGNV